MYHAAVRALLRHGMRRLNAGDGSFILRLAHPEAELAFPGDNTWATMFRPREEGHGPHVTHRGVGELTAFVDRFVELGIQFHVEDLLVAGWPHRTRVAVQGRMTGPPGAPGRAPYRNRVVSIVTIRWGRMVAWEDYEDTQRVAAWDAERARVPAATP